MQTAMAVWGNELAVQTAMANGKNQDYSGKTPPLL